KANALRLGDEPEQGAVSVEAPRAAFFDDLQARLVVAIEQLIRHLAGSRLVSQLERLGAVPLHAHDRHEGIRKDAAHRRAGLKVVELDRGAPSRARALPVTDAPLKEEVSLAKSPGPAKHGRSGPGRESRPPPA